MINIALAANGEPPTTNLHSSDSHQEMSATRILTTKKTLFERKQLAWDSEKMEWQQHDPDD